MKLRLLLLLTFLTLVSLHAQPLAESREQYDARMQWWSEARFGLFIHWGLYSIPAGEWNGKTGHGEWIRTTAQIPVMTYDKFVGEFNPVQFNADEWVRLAKEAGMKYIVITSKHHDGFCLFDSKETDFDVMSAPFKRDVLKELAEACRKQGMKLCFYHSIMDWHHPDYLPRREWEKDRPTVGADFDRYVQHMKKQVRELLTKYGDIGVLWFDGEWENTWTNARGEDLYKYVRGLQPNIIINNRVGAGRSGMEGFTKEGQFGGDFGTPEQQIPPTGLPGVNWETCMTMNDHWGFNSHDQNWKSSKELLQNLADIASKGGNFLLNIGPTSAGVFPQASIDRLRAIGGWMNVNREAIYGTKASPFATLSWGRCTQKSNAEGTRLYLHVFEWPASGALKVSGIFNEPVRAFLLADRAQTSLTVTRSEDALVISIPKLCPDSINSVVVLDVKGRPDISDPPVIDTTFSIFVDQLKVAVTSQREKVELRYTTDGSIPTSSSTVVNGSVVISQPCVLAVRCFRDGRAVSGMSKQAFRRVAAAPSRAVKPELGSTPVRYQYYEGDWDRLPDFGLLKPVAEGRTDTIALGPRKQPERYGMVFTGYLDVPLASVYAFALESDDGSRLWVDDVLVVDNDGLHSMEERRGTAALMAGLHAFRIEYFNKTGSEGLRASWMRPGGTMEPFTNGLFRGLR